MGIQVRMFMIVFCYQFCALCTCNSGLFRIQVLLRMKEVAFFLAQEHSTVTLVSAQSQSHLYLGRVALSALGWYQ